MTALQNSNFVMLEQIVQDSAAALASRALQAQPAVATTPAAPASFAPAPASKPGDGDGEFLSHIISALVPGLSAVGLVADVAAERHAKSSQPTVSRSRFLATRAAPLAARPTARPFVALSYAQKKQQATRPSRFVTGAAPTRQAPDLAARSTLAAMSLRSPLRGPVKAALHAVPDTRELHAQLTAARRELSAPSLAVIGNSLSSGDDRARQRVQAMAPTVQQKIKQQITPA